MELIIERTENAPEAEFDSVIESAAAGALREEGVTDDSQISVTLCTNDEIAVLNKEYMNRDGATDVLSFPMTAFDSDGKMIPESKVYDGDKLVLGDIVISLERAAEQAKEFGHSERREVGFLTVHSMLHLLGYDHMEEGEREKMQAKEKKILTAINLPREAEEK